MGLGHDTVPQELLGDLMALAENQLRVLLDRQPSLFDDDPAGED